MLSTTINLLDNEKEPVWFILYYWENEPAD